MNTDELIEQVLGIRIGSSPVYTAKDLLVDCYKGKESIIRDCTFDLRDLPFRSSAKDLHFRRGYTPPMEGLHVHHFDKGGAYLSACSGTDTGIGNPEHLEGGNIVPGMPGIYRISWHCDDPSRIPIIKDGQEWVTNDVLIYARGHGYQIIKIHEAWTWKEYARILGNRDPKRNWAGRLWKARQSLKEINEAAYQKMKVIALVGLGSFDTGKEKYGGLHLIHPNWWADVVGRARVNMLCNIEKFALVAGTPLLVYTDGLWYVSRDSNPFGAVPGILDRAGELGGYKYENSFILTRQIMNDTADMTPNELCTYFNHVGDDHE